MAPTTMPGQKTTTSPAGRNVETAGHPIRMSELLSTLKTPAFIARVGVHTPMHIINAKKAIKKAFQYQIDGRGFSLIEVLSMCPVNWKVTPAQAVGVVNDEMKTVFPLGVYKDKYAD